MKGRHPKLLSWSCLFMHHFAHRVASCAVLAWRSRISLKKKILYYSNFSPFISEPQPMYHTSVLLWNTASGDLFHREVKKKLCLAQPGHVLLQTVRMPLGRWAWCLAQGILIFVEWMNSLKLERNTICSGRFGDIWELAISPFPVE